MFFASNSLARAAEAGRWSDYTRFPRMLGDINGDGREDFVGFGDLGVYVATVRADSLI